MTDTFTPKTAAPTCPTCGNSPPTALCATATPAPEMLALKQSLEGALHGHTRLSRDCNLSGVYLCSFIWPLVESALRTAARQDDGAVREAAPASTMNLATGELDNQETDPAYFKPDPPPRCEVQSRDDIIEQCARLADGWLAIHGSTEIQYTSAREYASDAVEDIADAIRALKSSPVPSAEGN